MQEIAAYFDASVYYIILLSITTINPQLYIAIVGMGRNEVNCYIYIKQKINEGINFLVLHDCSFSFCIIIIKEFIV